MAGFHPGTRRTGRRAAEILPFSGLFGPAEDVDESLLAELEHWAPDFFAISNDVDQFPAFMHHRPSEFYNVRETKQYDMDGGKIVPFDDPIGHNEPLVRWATMGKHSMNIPYGSPEGYEVGLFQLNPAIEVGQWDARIRIIHANYMGTGWTAPLNPDTALVFGSDGIVRVGPGWAGTAADVGSFGVYVIEFTSQDRQAAATTFGYWGVEGNYGVFSQRDQAYMFNGSSMDFNLQPLPQKHTFHGMLTYSGQVNHLGEDAGQATSLNQLGLWNRVTEQHEAPVLISAGWHSSGDVGPAIADATPYLITEVIDHHGSQWLDIRLDHNAVFADGHENDWIRITVKDQGSLFLWDTWMGGTYLSKAAVNSTSYASWP